MLALVSHGIDTVRTRWTIGEDDALPVGKDWYRDELVRGGWLWKPTGELDAKTNQVRISSTFTWQDAALPSRRWFISSSGSRITTEFSVPKVLSDGRENLNLASPDQVREVLYAERERLMDRLHLDVLEIEGFSRVDAAADVTAGNGAAGVIAAGAQFRIAGRRKTSQHTYTGESAMYRFTEGTVRFYDKVREVLTKGQQDAKDALEAWLDKGRVRIEMEERPHGGITLEGMYGATLKLADRLEAAYPGGRVFVGGLDKLLQEVDALPIGTRARQSLVDFAVRWAHYGEQGMKQQMPERTYYRRKNAFLQSGLCLSDLVAWQGEVDFRPVVQQLRVAS